MALNITSDHAVSPVVIAVAPNGARRTKDDHPAIPLTATENAYEAAACLDAGAAMIHLHVRDKEGGHSLDADLYRNSIDEIRRAIGDKLIVQVTTEAVGIYTPAEQMEMVRKVRPEAISAAVRELVPDEAFEDLAANFFEWASCENIAVQYILYDDVDIRRFAELRRRGVLPDGPAFVLYVLGRYAKGQRSTPADLLRFLNVAAEVEADWHWSVCAFGAQEGSCAMCSVTLGGHARVGMENNLYLNDGSQTPGNAALVRQVFDGARLLSRPVADANTARELLSRII